MKKLNIKTDPRVEPVFKNYAPKVRKKIKHLRKLIIDTAKELEDVQDLEETLKWGEPSYIAKKGSTIRIDWKEKSPEQYAIYFKCTSRLVETFKPIFKNEFEFEGKRAIVFQMEDEVPEQELKSCIAAALRYHKVKHLPTLGI